MPADDRYDVVHALTIAEDHYGCHNRAEFKAGYWVRDGYEPLAEVHDGHAVAMPRFRWVPNIFTKHCIVPNEPAALSRCGDCFHKGDENV